MISSFVNSFLQMNSPSQAAIKMREIGLENYPVGYGVAPKS